MREYKPVLVSLYDLLGEITKDGDAAHKYIEFDNKIFVWNGHNYINPDNDYDLMCEFDLSSCRKPRIKILDYMKPRIKILDYIYCDDTCEETDDEEECINDSMSAYVTEDVAKED